MHESTYAHFRKYIYTATRTKTGDPQHQNTARKRIRISKPSTHADNAQTPQIGFRLRTENLSAKREWIEALRRGRIIQSHHAEANKEHAGGEIHHDKGHEHEESDDGVHEFTQDWRSIISEAWPRISLVCRDLESNRHCIRWFGTRVFLCWENALASRYSESQNRNSAELMWSVLQNIWTGRFPLLRKCRRFVLFWNPAPALGKVPDYVIRSWN